MINRCSALAQELAGYFPTCGSKYHPPNSEKMSARLVELCRLPELEEGSLEFREGVAYIKGASEVQLDDILSKTLGFVPGDGDKVLASPNRLVALIGQILLLCAAAHYIG